MATKKRLIDANKPIKETESIIIFRMCQHMPTEDYESFLNYLKKQPTVDAVEVADMKEFAEDVAYQFGYYCQNGGRLHITHGGLSTLEHTFDILGWENPHPVPECECDVDGCHEHATCGTPTADGYKRVCGQHFRSIRAKMDGDGNG